MALNLYLPEKYIDEIEILNTTKCDIEANYDELNGIENAPNTIELNGIGSKLIVIEK